MADAALAEADSSSPPPPFKLYVQLEGAQALNRIRSKILATGERVGCAH